jgi:hypothetical protein
LIDAACEKLAGDHVDWELAITSSPYFVVDKDCQDLFDKWIAHLGYDKFECTWSVDGDAEVNDRNRKLKNGEGSSAYDVRGWEVIRRKWPRLANSVKMTCYPEMWGDLAK